MSYKSRYADCLQWRRSFDAGLVARGGSLPFVPAEVGCRMVAERGLGQATVTTVTRTEQVPAQPSMPLPEGAKYAIGAVALSLLGGLGYLAWKYPSPMIGGGGGSRVGYGYSPGLTLTLNGRRRRSR